MKQISDTGLKLACAGMEFSWIYALAAFVMYPILKGPYPLPEAMTIFALSGFLTAYPRGRGWRNIQTLLAHGSGLAFFAARTVHFLLYRSEAFWCRNWAIDFFNRSLDVTQGFFLFVFLAWTLIFWIAGVRLVMRPRSYLSVCVRFDLGFASFFGIMIIKLMMRTRLDVQSGEVLSEYILYSFFIFALLSVALARNQSGTRKVFLAGYRGIGLLFSFSMGMLFFGTGLILLFLPYLKIASEAGYEVLKVAAQPVLSILTRVLLFLFKRGNMQPEVPEGPADSTYAIGVESIPAGEPNWWTELLLNITVWGFAILLGLVLLILIAIGIWFLLRWLFSKTGKDRQKVIDYYFVLRWLERGAVLLFKAYERFFSRSDRVRSVCFYTVLFRWGRRSGMPRRPSETPLEYGTRLKRQFRSVADEIDSIVTVFNNYAYGKTLPDRDQMTAAQAALRKMQSPILWPNRFKTRLLAIH